jgi:tetraacyldisaccharide 4'-kinase
MRAPAFYYRRPGLASFILLPFGLAYGAVAAARMKRPGARVGVPVICVGNPTLGGAGKTPTALAVARILAAIGETPAFLSRGYGGADAGPVLVDTGEHAANHVGDEPILLSAAFPTVVAHDRVAGARLAAGYGASTIVMDDGFQNPALAKDVSFLVVDAASGIGNGDVFPGGPLRAPLYAQLSLAHALVRVGTGNAADFVEGQAKAGGLPVFSARLVPDAEAVRELKGKKLLAFAGIGRPEKFFETLKTIGADVEMARGYADHHHYSAREARELLEIGKTRGLALVTTEKDRARMRGDRALAELETSARVLPVRLEFDNEAAVQNLLERALAKARR